MVEEFEEIAAWLEYVQGNTRENSEKFAREILSGLYRNS